MNVVTSLVCITTLSLAGCVAETGSDEPAPAPFAPTISAPTAAERELYPESCEPAVLDDAEDPEAAR